MSDLMYRDGMYLRTGTTDLDILKEQNSYKAVLPVQGLTVLDLGAHIGCFARWALKHGAKKIISVEPEPANFSILEANTKEYPVIRIMRAVTGTGDSREVPMYLNNKTNMATHTLLNKRGRDVILVQTIALQELLQEYRPSVIKVDIEGSEYMLEGALRNLPEFVEAIVMELHFFRSAWREHSAPHLIETIDRQLSRVKSQNYQNKTWNATFVWKGKI